MIVCQCNVLTKVDILAVCARDPLVAPRSPAQVQRCLGCAPQCGCCARLVRDLIAEAGITGYTVGCPTCPDNAVQPANDAVILVAAE